MAWSFRSLSRSTRDCIRRLKGQALGSARFKGDLANAEAFLNCGIIKK